MDNKKAAERMKRARRNKKALNQKNDLLIQENKKLREKVEAQLEECNNHFINASAVMNKKALESSLMSSKHQTGVEVDG